MKPALKRFATSVRILRWALIVACLLSVSSLPAQEPSKAENTEFVTARMGFEDFQYDWAEQKFAEFAEKYPESVLRARAVLFQGRARIEQKRYDAGIELLRANLDTAGAFADEYRFWIGEALLLSERFGDAAAAFADLIERNPESSFALSAAYRQAEAAHKQGDVERAIELLGAPDGAFESRRSREPDAEPSIWGTLLLAESLYMRGDVPGAEQALGRLPDGNLRNSASMRRNLLGSRIAHAKGELQPALERAVAAAKTAEEAGDKAFLAQAVSQQAAVQEALGRKPEALALYEKNLDAEVDIDLRRQAMVKTIELVLELSTTDAAVQKLQSFVNAKLDQPAVDLLQLTMGELRLRQFYSTPGAASQPASEWSPEVRAFINQAEDHFRVVTQVYTNSGHVGKASLNLGWCRWQVADFPAAREAFASATETLAASVDQAVALFKLADTEFKLGRYDAAAEHYRAVIDQHGQRREVREGLIDQVYYQLIQVGILSGRAELAANAAQSLLAEFPESYYADRGLLLAGQSLNVVRQPSTARSVFMALRERFPESELMPKARLAIARSYELEGMWNEAATEYASWLKDYPEQDNPLRPDAEFAQAHMFSLAGRPKDALTLFTDFAERYPSHPQTMKALQWVGDHYFNTGAYPEAERFYQRMFQGADRPAGRITYEARIFAARAAMKRQGYSDARDYLTGLINRAECPPEVLAEAWFALGDVWMQEPKEAGKEPENYKQARSAFNSSISINKNHALAPSAYGRLGDCHRQLQPFVGGANPGEQRDNFISTTNAYIQSLTHPLARVETRSQAAIGLGLSFELRAGEVPATEADEYRARAMERYLDVLYQTNIDRDNGEEPSLFWVNKAGMEAARLAEEMRDYERAIQICRRLADTIPPLNEYLNRRIRQLQEARAKQGG